MGNAGALRERARKRLRCAYESEREQPNASERSLRTWQCSRLERFELADLLSGGHALSLRTVLRWIALPPLRRPRTAAMLR